MHEPVDVWRVTGEACALVARNIGRAIAVWAPTFAAACLAAILLHDALELRWTTNGLMKRGGYALPDIAALLAAWLASLAVFALSAARWMRFAVEGDREPAAHAVRDAFGPVFAGLLALTILGAAAACAASALADRLTGGGAVIAMLAACALWIWACARLSLSLPARATGDDASGFADAWALTGGHGPRILAVFFLCAAGPAVAGWLVAALAASDKALILPSALALILIAMLGWALVFAALGRLHVALTSDFADGREPDLIDRLVARRRNDPR